MPIRILTAADVERALTMPLAIAAMRAAFTQLSAGQADLPARARITLFKSVGLAVQDAAAAGAVLREAERVGLGTLVPFD